MYIFHHLGNVTGVMPNVNWVQRFYLIKITFTRRLMGKLWRVISMKNTIINILGPVPLGGGCPHNRLQTESQASLAQSPACVIITNKIRDKQYAVYTNTQD